MKEAHTFEGEFIPRPYPYLPIFNDEYNPEGDLY